MRRIIKSLRHLGWSERILIAIFFATIPLVNPYIRGDGNGYYSYIRSLVIDGDLQFENEFDHGDRAFRTYVFDNDDRLRQPMVMPTGHIRNQWAIGSSLLWTPFFLAAHASVNIINRLGGNISADGYSSPYRWACALGTSLYAFIGLLLSYQIAKQSTSSSIALLSTIAIWLASPLPVYMYFLPFHVHALAAFSVSLFIWYWVRTKFDRSLRQWALWGAIGGLAVSVYYLNALFVLIPLSEWLSKARSGLVRGDEARARKIILIKGVGFTAALLAALIPHFIVKWILHGSPLNTGYMDEFFWNSPRLWQLAFSTEHGMFLWTPVLLPAVAGLVWLWQTDRWTAGVLLMTFTGFYYVVACYQNWHGISAFGNRFFVAFAPIFVLGLAIFIKESLAVLSHSFKSKSGNHNHPYGSRHALLIMAVPLLLMIAWNIGFIFQWGTKLVPNRGAVNFAVVARNQITVVPMRIAGFILHYLRSREGVTREIELEDLKELPEYKLQR